jgi:hypothetical protein
MWPCIQICTLLLLAVLACGCNQHRAIPRCPHDESLKTYKQWTESVSFPYAAPQERRQRIVRNYELVGVGSTKEEFVEAFGEPDYEQEMCRAPR